MTTTAHPNNPLGYILDDRARAGGPQWNSGELNSLVDAPGLPSTVRDLIPRHTELFFKMRDAGRGLEAARRDLEAAKDTDRSLAAEALASGKKPPARRLPPAEKALADAQATHQLHCDAVALIETKICAAVTQAAPEWLTHLDQYDQAARSDIEAALAQVAEALATQRRLAQLRVVATEPHRWASWKAARILPDATYEQSVALAELRQVALDDRA